MVPTVRHYPDYGVDLRTPEQIAMGHRLRNKARRLRRSLDPNPILGRALDTYRNLPIRRYSGVLS